MSLEITFPYDAILDLMRRLPPSRVQSNLSSLLRLVPHYADDLTSSIDVPLTVRTCKQTGKEYLCCDYNRDGESYRSPFSDEYDPPLPDGTKSLPKHRALEIAANEAFDMYRDMYFDGGLSSVYIWDGEDAENFAGAVLIKKALDPPSKDSWDSIHVFEATDPPPEQRGRRTATYRLTSTIILSNEKSFHVHSPQSHTINVGRMIEELESKMRPSQIRTTLKFNTRGIVAMANSGPDTNKAQFFITYAKQSHLDNKYTIFERVIDGMEALEAKERTPVNEKNRPLKEIKINKVILHANPIANNAVDR